MSAPKEGPALILRFHGLPVPHLMLAQLASGLSQAMGLTLRMSPASLPLPADGTPWLEMEFETAPGPEALAFSHVMAEALEEELPEGTRITAPPFPPGTTH